MAPRLRAPNPSASKVRPERNTDVRGGDVTEGFLPLASSSAADASQCGPGERRGTECCRREGLVIDADVERGLCGASEEKGSGEEEPCCCSSRSASASARDWIQEARSRKAAERKEKARMAARSWAEERQMKA